MDPHYEGPSQEAPVQAVGAVILKRQDSGPLQVAILRRQGTVCLPRVLIHPGETTRTAAERSVYDQVSPALPCERWSHLAQVQAEVSGHPLTTDYWSAFASESNLSLRPDCFWLPLAQAAKQVAFPEERQFLATMEDPLIQTPPAQADLDPTSRGDFPRVPTSAPSRSRWPFDPHRGRLAETIAAARASVENTGRSSDWRESALLLLNQAEDAVQAGRLDAAQEALTGAWRLELESRSVGERRLLTQLLRGEVRTRTDGWHRDSLLTALQESPDAGTMALVRCELERQSRRISQTQTRNDLGRLAQVVIAVPVLITLFVSFSSSWLDGSVPSSGELMPATLGLGMLGGLGWSLFRSRVTNFFEAIVPLGVGAAAAFFGLLLSKAGILTISQDSAPWALCLAIIWGAAAAALLDFKNRK
ncbi:MAG: hypothetical protein ACI87O_002907 [Planctomycetota bacterium]